MFTYLPVEKRSTISSYILNLSVYYSRESIYVFILFTIPEKKSSWERKMNEPIISGDSQGIHKSELGAGGGMKFFDS